MELPQLVRHVIMFFNEVAACCPCSKVGCYYRMSRQPGHTANIVDCLISR